MELVQLFNKITIKDRSKIKKDDCDKATFTLTLGADGFIEDYMQITIDLLSKGISMNLKETMEFFKLYQRYKAEMDNSVPIYYYKEPLDNNIIKSMINNGIICIEKRNDKENNIITDILKLYKLNMNYNNKKTKYHFLKKHETTRDTNDILKEEIDFVNAKDGLNNFVNELWNELNKEDEYIIKAEIDFINAKDELNNFVNELWNELNKEDEHAIKNEARVTNVIKIDPNNKLTKFEKLKFIIEDLNITNEDIEKRYELIKNEILYSTEDKFLFIRNSLIENDYMTIEYLKRAAEKELLEERCEEKGYDINEIKSLI